MPKKFCLKREKGTKHVSFKKKVLDINNVNYNEQNQLINPNIFNFLFAQDLETLRDSNWLINSVIDSYIHLIIRKNIQKSIHLINSNLVYHLLTNHQIPSLENINIFGNQLVFFPICDNQHWTLLVLDNRKRSIIYYDSLMNHRIPNHLIQFIKKHHQKYCSISFESFWRIERSDNIPRQTDGSSCGVFICQYARCIAADKEFDFSQQSMTLLRQLMIYELVTGSLVDEKIKFQFISRDSELNTGPIVQSAKRKQTIELLDENFFNSIESERANKRLCSELNNSEISILNSQILCSTDAEQPVRDVVIGEAISCNDKLKHKERYQQIKGRKYSVQKSKVKRNYLARRKVKITADENVVNHIKTHYLGQMNKECINCKALYFKSERMNCCDENLKDVLWKFLQTLEDIPPFFKEIFNDEHPLSSTFFKYIRQINSAFSFVSHGVRKGETGGIEVDNSKGGSTFLCKGWPYHYIGSLETNNKNEPKFCQIYLYDTNFQIERRKEIFSGFGITLDKNLVSIIQKILETENQLIQKFKQIGTDVLKQEGFALEIIDDVKNLDLRVYNKPTNDFAAIIPYRNNSLKNPRHIVIRSKAGYLQKISHRHSHYHALSYVLFYPKGGSSWNSQIKVNLPSKKRNQQVQKNEQIMESEDESIDSDEEERNLNEKTNLIEKEKFERTRPVTLLMFLNFILQIRSGLFNCIFKGRSLFLQFITLAWLDVESDRLGYIWRNQTKLRVDTYRGLLDAYAKGRKAKDIGKLNILPSTYVGSPRYYNQLYHDAMSIVSTHGKPDVFLTMTTNPKWREIQENLMKGQTSWDRPDLCSRVFHEKFGRLISDVKKGAIFGPVKAFVWVVEFQKRGLPHGHLLIILKNTIDTKELIDKYVKAEIPDQERQPELYKKVLSYMIHNPCKEGSKCFINGKCSKGFPKNYRNETICDVDSFPLYKRSKTSPIKYTYNRQTYNLTNRYVVPYCPKLIQRFDCHINVEICTSIRAVKYLYKYVYKGPDQAMIKVDNFDEVKHYMDSRWVSATESYWKLKSYSIHGNFPKVHRLPVHNENFQSATFKNDSNLATVLKQQKPTKLIAWMHSNKMHPEYKHLNYLDYPNFFRFDKKNGKWVLRSKKRRGKVNLVTRMYRIAPSDIETFHLRLILKYQRGAESFKDLLTVNNKKFDSFVEVARELKLLENDSIWIDTMNEAVDVLSPSKCRNIFIQILMHSQVIQPIDLYESFKTDLYEDYRYQNPFFAKQELEMMLLNSLKCLANECNFSLEDLRLPLLETEENEQIYSFDKNNCRASMYNCTDYNRIDLLTTEQKEIFDHIIRLNRKKSPKTDNIIFVDAFAGSGKTFLLNCLITKLNQMSLKVISVAHSGIAATLLQDGVTAHSLFKIPLDIPESTFPVCNIQKNSKLAKLLIEADVIIWDEASMSDKNMLECVDRTLRDLINIDLKFGGKIVILAGDFRQILPIIKNGNRVDIVRNCIKSSYIWQDIVKFHLTENLRLGRQKQDREFAEYLLKIGENRIEHNAEDEIVLKKELIFENNSVDDFLEYFYPKETFKETHPYSYQSTAILAPLNTEVRELNERLLNKFSSESLSKTYLSKNIVDDECENLTISEQFVNEINQTGLPIHELKLKTGSIIMLIRNINIHRGLCNGTRLRVLKLHSHLICAEIIAGRFKGSTVEIPRITIFSDKEQVIRFKRIQFPVVLAFAQTVNKSQGQTLENVGLYANTNLFVHGQLYVVLSRGSNYKRIKVFFHQQNRQKINNIVYEEVLNSGL